MERHPHEAASIIDAFRSLRSHPSCQSEMHWSYEAHSPILDEKIEVPPFGADLDYIVEIDAGYAVCLLRGSVGPWSVCREIDVNDDVIRQIRRKLDGICQDRYGT